MSSGNAWRADRALRRSGLTALNVATTLAYLDCGGRHTPSGDTVRRWFPGADRELQVCATCGVPYGAPRTNWSSGTSPSRGPRVR